MATKTLVNAQIVSGTEEDRLDLEAEINEIDENTIFVTLPAVPTPNNPPTSPATVQAKSYIVLTLGGVKQWVELCCDAVTGP